MRSFWIVCERPSANAGRGSMYVLMTNHVDLLPEPVRAGDMGRFMQSVERRSVRSLNDVHEHMGMVDAFLRTVEVMWKSQRRWTEITVPL